MGEKQVAPAQISCLETSYTKSSRLQDTLCSVPIPYRQRSGTLNCVSDPRAWLDIITYQAPASGLWGIHLTTPSESSIGVERAAARETVLASQSLLRIPQHEVRAMRDRNRGCQKWLEICRVGFARYFVCKRAQMGSHASSSRSCIHLAVLWKQCEAKAINCLLGVARLKNYLAKTH